jgi:hypothetical protein
LDANLAVLAQLNGARKLFLEQLRAATSAAADGGELRGAAVQLSATVRRVRALPPIPEPTAALEFAASLDSFEAALAELLRVDLQPAATEAVSQIKTITDLMLESAGHYQTATTALHRAFA